jgi:nicotinate-nucleotide adenylyltransferase
MTKHALKDVRRCNVLPLEMQADSTSYTVKTIDTLLKKGIINDNDRLYIICGADILFEFENWYQPDKILKKSELMIAMRPGIPNTNTLNKASEIEGKYGKAVHFFDIEEVPESSSYIRITRDYSGLPETVSDFIRMNGLYPDDNPLAALNNDTYDTFLKCCIQLFSNLSERRLLHSLNTAILSVRYALRFGMDPNAAGMAGLLHDCAKELPIRRQNDLAGEIQSGELPSAEMLHAPAGVKYAEIKYNITDTTVLDAIRFHTTGRRKMTGIDKIVYLADKLEPAREFDDLTEIRRLVKFDLDEALIECLTAVRECLNRKGLKFHEDSEQALQELYQTRSD